KETVDSEPAAGLDRVRVGRKSVVLGRCVAMMGSRVTAQQPLVAVLLRVRLVAVGESLTPVTVTLMLPSAGPVLAASRMRVLMVKFWSLSAEGVRVTAARAALSSVREPATLHTPVPGL